jgi:hypothetical protein
MHKMTKLVKERLGLRKEQPGNLRHSLSAEMRTKNQTSRTDRMHPFSTDTMISQSKQTTNDIQGGTINRWGSEVAHNTSCGRCVAWTSLGEPEASCMRVLALLGDGKDNLVNKESIRGRIKGKPDVGASQSRYVRILHPCLHRKRDTNGRPGA